MRRSSSAQIIQRNVSGPRNLKPDKTLNERSMSVEELVKYVDDHKALPNENKALYYYPSEHNLKKKTTKWSNQGRRMSYLD